MVQEILAILIGCAIIIVVVGVVTLWKRPSTNKLKADSPISKGSDVLVFKCDSAMSWVTFIDVRNTILRQVDSSEKVVLLPYGVSLVSPVKESVPITTSVPNDAVPGKVFLLTIGEHAEEGNEWDVKGIYSTKELAETAKALYEAPRVYINDGFKRTHCYAANPIEERIVDPLLPGGF